MPTTTTNFGFVKPDRFQINWDTALNGTLDQIDSLIASITGAGAHVVSYSATPVFDASLGTTQVITLSGGVTASTVSNAKAGILTLVVAQDSSGGHSFTFPTNFRQAGSISSADGTAGPSSYCTQSFVYIPSSGVYLAITPLIYGE
jgi:hypothetical protein